MSDSTLPPVVITIVPNGAGVDIRVAATQPGITRATVARLVINAAAELLQQPGAVFETVAQVQAKQRVEAVTRECPAVEVWMNADVSLWLSAQAIEKLLGRLLAAGFRRVMEVPADVVKPCAYVLNPNEVEKLLVQDSEGEDKGDSGSGESVAPTGEDSGEDDADEFPA